MIEVRRLDPRRLPGIPRVHFIERDGVRTYRLWTNESSEYTTDELTVDELADVRLRSRLQQSLFEWVLQSRQEIFFDVSASGWVNKSNMFSLENVAEQRRETDELPVGETCTMNAREAHVALMAIKAYRAYVAAGHDPARLPAMIFEHNAFAVMLGNES